jgi:hypothetical protein
VPRVLAFEKFQLSIFKNTMDKGQLDITSDMEKLDIGELLAPSSPLKDKNEDQYEDLLTPEELYHCALGVCNAMEVQLYKADILNPTWSQEDVNGWYREIESFYDLRNSPLLYDREANLRLFNSLCNLHYDYLRLIQTVRGYHSRPK